MSAVNFAQPPAALPSCNPASGERSPALLANLTVNRQNIKFPTQTQMIGTGNAAEVQSNHAPAPLEGNPQLLPGPSQPRGENSGDDQQQPSAGKKLSSRYRGVCWNKKNKRWQAAINSSGKYLYLGSYVLEEDAARAFDKAAIRIRGRKARINFKFDEYLPELKLHSQSQCQAQHPNLKEELGGVGQDSHGLGPTKAPRVDVPYHQDCQFTPARSDHLHRPYGGFQGHIHHSNPSDREGVINGVPLHRDDRMGGARLDMATPLRSETFWGRVLTSNAECGTADVSFPLPALGHGLQPEHQTRPQHQYVDMGLPVQTGQSQALAVAEAPHSIRHIQPSQPQDPYKFPLVAGFASPKVPVQNPPPEQPADPMRTMPSDCQIVKIIPNACGVFGMMYARPGCINTGALIWDGHAAHNLGMFSTRDDAQQACTAASLIVVKIVQQALQGSSINYTAPAMPNHVQHGPKVESQLVQDLKQLPAASAPPPASVPSAQQVANPERQQPQQSPLGCPNPENFLRLMSSITSEDIGKILHGNHVGEVQSEKGAPAVQLEYAHVASSQADANGIPLSQGPSNGGAGSLGGPMVYYDSISSSIVGLISMADARGMDPIVIDEKPMDSKQRVGWGGSELRTIPTIRGSLTELGPALFGSGQQDEGKLPPRLTQDRRDPAGEEIPSSHPVPIATTPFATPTSLPSAMPPQDEKNAYNDVVDLIVSQEKTARHGVVGVEEKKSPPPSRECPDEQIEAEHGIAEKRSAPKRKFEDEGAGGDPSLIELRKKLKTDEWKPSEGDGMNHT
ncbi:hypothetical protein BSKO_01697 [Bryopsis sp. KO-2023]|nr:hypothetical protein BSKO_01697 [Bryopsis sp. KO-2023]